MIDKAKPAALLHLALPSVIEQRDALLSHGLFTEAHRTRCYSLLPAQEWALKAMWDGFLLEQDKVFLCLPRSLDAISASALPIEGCCVSMERQSCQDMEDCKEWTQIYYNMTVSGW